MSYFIISKLQTSSLFQLKRRIWNINLIFLKLKKFLRFLKKTKNLKSEELILNDEDSYYKWIWNSDKPS